jgi:hypothetical protein
MRHVAIGVTTAGVTIGMTVGVTIYVTVGVTIYVTVGVTLPSYPEGRRRGVVGPCVRA